MTYSLHQMKLTRRPNVVYITNYVNIVSDYEYKCTAHVFSEDVSKNNKNIFTYLYDYRSSTSCAFGRALVRFWYAIILTDYSKNDSKNQFIINYYRDIGVSMVK